MNCIADKSSERRVTSFPMKDLGGSGRNSAYADRSGDAPVSLTIKLTSQINKHKHFSTRTSEKVCWQSTL